MYSLFLSIVPFPVCVPQESQRLAQREMNALFCRSAGDSLAAQLQGSAGTDYRSVLHWSLPSTEVENDDQHSYAVVPRRRSTGFLDHRQPVHLTHDVLSKFFDVPLSTAAKELVRHG